MNEDRKIRGRLWRAKVRGTLRPNRLLLASVAIAIGMSVPWTAPLAQTAATTLAAAIANGPPSVLGLEYQAFPSGGDATFGPTGLSLVPPTSEPGAGIPHNPCLTDPFTAGTMTATDQGMAGSKVVLSVSTICGSAPFSVGWTFGDGGTASQTSANSTGPSWDQGATFTFDHIYKSQGVYVASVSITDGASSTVTASVRVFAAFTPALFDTFYNESGVLASGHTGSTYAIGLVEECYKNLNDSYYQNELAAFDTQFGLPSLKLHFSTGGGSSCTGTGGIWSPVETALDIEWAHVAAPGAQIYVCLDTLDTVAGLEGCDQQFYNQRASWNTMIASNSWGTCAQGYSYPSCPNAVDPYQTTWSNAVSAGMNLFASSGDHTPDLCAYSLYPASNPYAIAVGGTTISTVGSGGAYGSEKVWYDSGTSLQCYYYRGPNLYPFYGNLGETYGTNPYYAATSYQSSLLGNTNRYFPDVSMVGNQSTGVPVDFNGTWLIVGGTSVGSPIWAGILDVLFSASAPGLSGWAIPFLYAHPGCFHALTNPVTGGRDGLGSPNVGCLSTA
jgi:subtilase family serine protease